MPTQVSVSKTKNSKPSIEVDIPTVIDAVMPDRKTDAFIAAGTIVLVSGVVVYGIWATAREEKNKREIVERRNREIKADRDREKQRLEDERTKAQDAAMAGYTILPNSDGTYWIIPPNPSMKELLSQENGKIVSMPPHPSMTD